MARTSKNSTSSRLSDLKSAWLDVKQSPSLHAVLGLTVLFIGLLGFVASTSTLFTWTSDYSALELGFAQVLSQRDIVIQNTLGSIGAAVGMVVTVRGFGIASLLLWTVIMAFGLRWGLGIELRALRWARRSLLRALLITSGLALLPWNAGDAVVGDYGRVIATWSTHWLGLLGACLTWMVLALIHTVWVFQLRPQMLGQHLANRFAATDALNEVPIDEEAELIPDEGPLVVDLFGSEPNQSPPWNEDDEDLALEPSMVADDDLDLEIQSTVEAPQASPSLVKPAAASDMGPYDPRRDLSRYQTPPLQLLNDYGQSTAKVDQEELEANKERILETLRNYKIEISKIKATVGPTVTLYEIVPEAGVRISRIKSLEDDIALSLSALGIRIIAPIPGKGTIGIEVPNRHPQMVSMRSVLASEKFQKSDMDLPLALGKTISNEVYIVDLAKMPHLLMAGATGQGKSVGLNAIIASILYKKHPAEVKFVLVDPKKVELTLYNTIERHFLAKLPGDDEAIITDTNKVIYTLNSLCIEMDQRYELLKSAMVRNLKEYNVKFTARKLNPEEGHRYLPYIILVIDEFADLIMTAGKEVEMPIARLAQLARAIGIHLIVATQRPSVNVITGIIKANFPTRIAFKVSAKIDSRTILDAGGAEQLIGKGDMLISSGNDLIRLQCAFLDTPEVEQICEFIGSQQGYPDAYQLPEYESEEGRLGGGGNFSAEERDSMFEEAARMVVIHQQGSASLLQRKLKLGYNRAGRLVDQLEDAGIIGPFEGSKARQVLIQDEVQLNERLKNL
ncbi:MAG: DNA translocase FtsK [Cryomorphaceae bacterium]|nr:DNA translocase FtsK [Cryomorphaceae bacterium]